MTLHEALNRMHAATLADIGAMDPDMIFGGYSKAFAVDALNQAISCAFIGPHFTVVSVEVEFCAYFAGDKIDGAGMGPRRK